MPSKATIAVRDTTRSTSSRAGNAVPGSSSKPSFPASEAIVSPRRFRWSETEIAQPSRSEHLLGALERAEQEKRGYTPFLADLLAAEATATEERRLAGRLRFANFRSSKVLEEFDFSAQPNLDRRLIEELATLRFIEEKANALLIGPPGVGKAMLAITLGLRAVDAGYRVYYTTAADLVARTARVITRRCEHGSIILTTNRGIASWGEIFEDTTVAVAILDGLLHHATVLQIGGESYRMRGHRARLTQLRASLNQGGENSRSQVGNSDDR